MNSPNGPSSTTEKTGFSVDDVCRILEACGKSRVAVLELGPLFISFGQPEPKVENVSEDLFQPTAAIVAIQKQQAERALLADEIRLKQSQLDELPLSDPYLNEQLLISGELEDDRRSNEQV